jgi:S1-C subfamily serine protease
MEVLMASETSSFAAFSESLEQAVSKAGESTVMVNGRHRFPASGIAYAQDLILTADHVVERDDDVTIMLSNGAVVPVTIAGRDPGDDLALLRLENTTTSPAEKAKKEARVGQIVLALGRPSSEGLEASLGVVSAIGGPVRTGRGGLLERYLRTDTTPFPGFSGGPLVDAEGKILGLNTSGLAHGAAITIPAFLAWSVAENLAKYGYIKRGYLGIRSQIVELSDELQKSLARMQESGLLLVSVETGSAAEAAGLLVGDILVGINGQSIKDHDDLMVHLTSDAVGKPASIQVIRGGQPTTINLTIGERK